MQRVAVIVDLVPGGAERAAALLAHGPPFDLEDAGFTRHTVFLGHDRAVFVFEGDDVERLVSSVANDPVTAAALTGWGRLLKGNPHIVREAFSWESG